ncbi:hypothetical protein PF005_g24181 [Phytophthora fragariae]|uniref:Uncharacterized protein n=1 Tax=Phytophthora fragariae TaxID=53985 RepID=A0A6A3SI17_9STRA|nr:hypothetical protein PF003_g40619 [Phytophthora fragariae]KAE8924797.1 hypothetical protein PF009_g24977 [Phytophthora fragariae]KAE8978388.1 hypothetical protein PF011_g23263 [Phytophthora fragariae]KAE9063240.1 hypothetical protein PF010_g29077 [Phytophthora fragariae]KAE9088852.1 hypothetical protein PF007_g19822 [Phytophthora fragariae]
MAPYTGTVSCRRRPSASRNFSVTLLLSITARSLASLRKLAIIRPSETAPSM